MSEALQVKIDRARPTCPFCKDEVASGHVWVCPGCEASHHAACHDEHGACASCALAEPRQGASIASKADAPDDEGPRGLASRRRELERLGFTLVRETPDELVGVHASWPPDPLEDAARHTVVVRRVKQLTVATLEADAERLRKDPLASKITVAVYLTATVDPDVVRFVETGRPARSDEVRVFLAIHDEATAVDSFPLGIPSLPRGVRDLMKRLLKPSLAALPPASEAFSTAVLMALWVVALAALVALIGVMKR